MSEINLEGVTIVEENSGQPTDVDLQKKATDPGEPDPSSKGKNEVDWESEDNPYKKRFAGSTKEFEEFYKPKFKELEGLTAQEKARAEELQKTNEELLAKLKDEKPDTYDNVTLQKTLEKNSRELAEMKEKALLDDFISDTPEAKAYREALKSHARAFPTKPIADIWNESFKEIATAKKENAAKETTRQKESQPDKGDGGTTTDPSEAKIAGYTQKEFDALPVSKRREILVKNGISM